jgi:hypothetical protein
VLDTARGDALVCESWPSNGVGRPQAQGWRERLGRMRPGADAGPATEPPDVLVVLGGPVEASPRLRTAGCPVLLLSSGLASESAAGALRAAGQRVASLRLSDLATWREDGQLRTALGQLLPSHMAPGWTRLSAAWDENARARLARSMQALADELLACARDTQPLDVSPLGMRQLVVRGERDASEAARQAAVAALVARVGERQQATDRHLLALHGVDATAHASAGHALPGEVRVHHAVDEPQAGLAGVASGAAMGAAVDLMTGGLTLGAASALGALVGGGAALVAAAWKNRAGQPGASLVMLDDRVLLGLADLAVLRYVRVAHAGRAGSGGAGGWEEAVRAESRPQASHLREVLAQARSPKDGASAGTRLADVLQQVALGVLARLHGRA